jgi:hypothetical protein
MANFPTIAIGLPFVHSSGLVPILDLYPNAAAAYSLRLLRTAYSGNAILLRRSSDNATQQIGFVDGNFDLASATAFIGGGSGFIVTWYDQSGNGRNVTNAVAANQPKLSLNTFNGKSTVLFDTNLQQLQGNFGVFTYTGAGDFYVANSSSQAVGGQYGSYLHQGNSIGTNKAQLLIFNQTFPNANIKPSLDSYAGIIANQTSASNTNLNEKVIFRFSWSNWSTANTNGNTIISKNGTNYGLTFPTSPTSLLTNKTTIGRTDDGGFVSQQQFFGSIPEVIIYTSQQSASGIIQDQLNYYGI